MNGANDMTIAGLFLDASFLVQAIMVLLLLISVVSWALIFQRSGVLNTAARKSKQFEDRFWSGVDLSQLSSELTAGNKTARGLESLFIAGYREFMRLRQQKGVSPEAVMDGTHRAMRVAHSREVEKLEQNLSFLATVGSVTPYIGLFGTVWGIMNSFIALGSVKQATLAMVAPGIAEALIATAMGLFAAIPAVIAYNRFTNRLQRIETQYENFLEEFSGILHRKAHS
ncbi:colicin uptake protein TolQ [Kangiella sediminilitoris]|uniref:Tol-Pal system protein TolQ n=2 Tax=Kangiella sediminilitoris TaxID=1144748 RepID=A0A1B3BC43_9GAMM|nr:colicin uptake protein TolQ [Kangiella sediminilitoris]